ncbi:MAG: ABC transporter substrate-binding protein [Pseudomonadota bacterium]
MKRLDRRALFASGAAAALLAASGLAVDALPRRGGKLRIAVQDGAGARAVAHGAVFETLTEVGADGLLRGEGATSWHGNADATVWHFHLRPGTVFHDGTSLTAKDVIATLERPDSPVAQTIAELQETEDGLRIALHEGDPGFPYLLADPRLAITPAGAVEDDMARWCGSGLYKVVTARNGRQWLGRRVDSHWKDGQAGWADAVEVISITDPAVREEALSDGYVDVAELDQEVRFGDHVGRPSIVSGRSRLDDGRIAERWWLT